MNTYKRHTTYQDQRVSVAIPPELIPTIIYTNKKDSYLLLQMRTIRIIFPGIEILIVAR